MQVIITLDRDVLLGTTDRETQEFFGSLNPRNADTNMFILNCDANTRNAVEIRASRYVTDACVAAIYALVTGANNYRPSFVREVTGDFGSGFFLRMQRPTGEFVVESMTSNKTVNPRDFLFLSGNRDLVSAQFLTKMPTNGISVKELSGEQSKMNFLAFAHLNKLAIECDKSFRVEVVDDNLKLLRLNGKSKEKTVVDINGLEGEAFLPIRMGFEALMNRKARIITIIDCQKTKREVLERMVDFFAETGNTMIVLINNKAGFSVGQNVVKL